MKIQHIVQALEAAAQQLGIRVRRERGGFRGGRCKIGTEEVIVLNKRHPHEVHLAILAEALRDQRVDTIFLRPAVRRALEDMWLRQETVVVAAEDDAE